MRTIASPPVNIHTVAAELATAPLRLYPIRRLTTHNNPASTEWALQGLIQAGAIRIDTHIDAVVILDRELLADLATRELACTV